jgi:hypothetical protein
MELYQKRSSILYHSCRGKSGCGGVGGKAVNEQLERWDQLGPAGAPKAEEALQF